MSISLGLSAVTHFVCYLRSSVRMSPCIALGRSRSIAVLLCVIFSSISFSYSLQKVTVLRNSAYFSTRRTPTSTKLNALVPIKQITDNKKSGFEYEFTDRFIAGLMLTGTEVKSCRKGMVQLSDSMAEIIDGECWLLNCHIGKQRHDVSKSYGNGSRCHRQTTSVTETSLCYQFGKRSSDTYCIICN
jgi:SmpB protein